MEQKTRILVVEDEGIVALDIQNRLKRLGFEIAGVAHTGPTAVYKASNTNPDLILMDIKLRGTTNGIEAAQEIKSELDIPIVFLTAFADEATLQKAQLTEPFGYLLKPFKERELLATIQTALIRHKLEQQLKEREQWLHTTLKSIGDAVIATDVQGHIKFMNFWAESLTGWTQNEAVGVPASEVFKIIDGTTREPSRSPIEKVMQTGQIAFLQNNTLLIGKDGVETPIDDSAAPIKDEHGKVIGVVLVFRDVSEQKQTQAMLLQAQKLESLGVLAGGVAHDFNNLLVGILGQTSLALAKLPLDSPVRNNIQKAVKAAERAADLTGQMLAYSGRGKFEIRSLDLNKLIQDSFHLFQAAIPKNVTLQLQLDGNLPLIEGDASQMNQVVMNLLLNAAESIVEPTGVVTIKTCQQSVTDADDQLWSNTGKPLNHGPYVVLEVVDNGQGMNAEIKERIFEPFFSTKLTGRGLGLASVLGIVRGHKGGLEVMSTLNEGTIFRLAFPASVDNFGERGETAVSPLKISETDDNSRTVLVIDDEMAVREVVTDILEMEDLHVLTAANGTEGIQLYRQNANDIDLVLLDLSMPGLSGEETFYQLSKINPQIKVLLSSGYDQEEVKRRFSGKGIAGFIPKPYSWETLIDVVQSYL